MFHVQSPEQLGTQPICWSSYLRVLRRSDCGRKPPTGIDVNRPLTMQRACHVRACPTLAVVLLLFGTIVPVCAAPPANSYPTQALVEYVNDCVARHGAKLSQVYQCSCVIDRIADSLSYDDFVEASTFARYSTLPGEGAGIFRDSDEAKAKAKMYRELETKAYRDCGLESKD